MSLASSVKENPHCLVCNGRVGVSTRNSFQIFSKDTTTCSERPLPFIMSQVLGTEIKEDAVHTLLICKKCFKLFDEVDELEQRLLEIKVELVGNFKKSIQKNKNGGDISEEAAEKLEDVELVLIKEKLEATDSNKENQVPKKILDIPSSDDETTQEPMEKTTFNTIEDIELELEKIHGSVTVVDKVQTTNNVPQYVLEQTGQTVQGFPEDIVDSGAVDHSSDSDYEPPGNEGTPETLLHVAAMAERNLVSEEKVTIKLEPNMDCDDKPNILKRKGPPHIRNKFMPKKIKEEFLPPIVNRDGNLYTCLMCDGEETVYGEAKAIMLHMKSAHDTRLYICDVCGEDFRKRNELSVHLDEHVATEEGDFQCEVCNRIFSNLRLFRIHKRMHYPQNKAWTCGKCDKKYSSKNLLDEHMNTHTGARPYVCQRQMCGKAFASKYTFKAHEKTHEIRPRPFQCGQCNKTFLSQQNLTQHERTHSGIKEFQCHLCEKQFGSAHNLEVHSIVHTGYKPHICGSCGKAFARKAEIRDHERTHTGERPYQCEFCGATFSQRSNLQSHKRATHYDDKRYKCEECGKGFKRRRLLDYHVKAAHTGERPFKCDVCEATFVYPEHFKKHRRIHTGEKPFCCEVCGKAFNSRDNRNAHRFVHSDKKPYECLVCGAGFMRKPLLFQHMQSLGHLNDTIVVNQPRLTTDDDQIITVNAEGEMEIVDGDISRLEHINENDEDMNEDSKLYIAELKDHMLVEGNEVFGHPKGTLIVGGDDIEEDQLEDNEAVEHIIIDGQQLQFTEDEDGEVEELEEMEEGEQTQQILTTEDYEGLITSEALANGETQIIQTKDGPIQLVQVRIPNDNGEEEDAWLKIVPE